MNVPISVPLPTIDSKLRIFPTTYVVTDTTLLQILLQKIVTEVNKFFKYEFNSESFLIVSSKVTVEPKIEPLSQTVEPKFEPKMAEIFDPKITT